MSFIGTSCTFSARGFGGLGNNSVIIPFDGTAIGYGTTSNQIYNIAMDASNNLIGTYGTYNTTYPQLGGGQYLFKYSPKTKLIYWINNARSATVGGTTDGYAISFGNYNSIVFPFNGTAGITGTTNTSYWRRTFSGVNPLNYGTIDGNDIYGFVFNEANGTTVQQGGAVIFNVTSTGTSVGTITVKYTQVLNPSTGIITTTGAGITGANGKYVKIYGQYGEGIGTGTSNYSSGYYNIITSGTIVKYISKNAYCYIAYTNSGSAGIARLDNAGNLTNNYTYTDGGTMNVTGFDVDVVNGYMFLSYNNGTEDRIVKFDLDGNVQWTKKLTKTSGLLGIKQIVCSNDGLYYYLSTSNNIFQFPANGDIIAPGYYVSNGVTYTYSDADAWINSTSNLFNLNSTQYSWTGSTGGASGTFTSGSPTSSTPLLTWNVF